MLDILICRDCLAKLALNKIKYWYAHSLRSVWVSLTIDLNLDDGEIRSELVLQGQAVPTIILFVGLLDGQNGVVLGHFLDVVTSIELHSLSDPFHCWFGITSKWNLDDDGFSFLKGTYFLESGWHIDFGWSCKKQVENFNDCPSELLCWQLCLSTFKQEAHGPHRSPENEFQSINTFAHDKTRPQCWLR